MVVAPSGPLVQYSTLRYIMIGESQGRVVHMTVEGIRGSSDRSVLVLTSLAGGPKHGYALIKDIEGFASVKLVLGRCTVASPSSNRRVLWKLCPQRTDDIPIALPPLGWKPSERGSLSPRVSPNSGWAELQEPCHEQLAVSLTGGALPKAWRERYSKEVGDLSTELLEAGETTRLHLTVELARSALVERVRSLHRAASLRSCLAVRLSSLSWWPPSW